MLALRYQVLASRIETPALIPADSDLRFPVQANGILAPVARDASRG